MDPRAFFFLSLFNVSGFIGLLDLDSETVSLGYMGWTSIGYWDDMLFWFRYSYRVVSSI